MSSVTIVLTDNNEGTVNQVVTYEMLDSEGAPKGAFDNNSQAHQYSRVMLGLASDFAKGGVPTITEESGIILLG